MFRHHILQLLSKHRLAVILSAILVLVLILLGVHEQSVAKVITYLLTLLAAFLVSEFVYFSGNFSYSPWLIKSPKKELWVIIGTQIIVAILLIYWFMLADQQSVSTVFKIAVLVLRLLFVFPIFFLIYFLAIKRYNLKQLGILNLSRWYVCLPIIVLIGGASYLFFPEGLQFEDIILENGYLSLITLGFLTAAVPEEITRNLLQSRLGLVLKSKSLGWFLSSLVWALIHIPLFSFKTGNHYNAFISSLGILPLGLLWGYLNQRYRSIIPAVIIHGTNLWGIHNLF